MAINIVEVTKTLKVVVTNFSETFSSYFAYTPQVCEKEIPYREIYNRVALPEKFTWKWSYSCERDMEMGDNPFLMVIWESYSERHWEDSPKEQDVRKLFEIFKEMDIL